MLILDIGGHGVMVKPCGCAEAGVVVGTVVVLGIRRVVWDSDRVSHVMRTKELPDWSLLLNSMHPVFPSTALLSIPWSVMSAWAYRSSLQVRLGVVDRSAVRLCGTRLQATKSTGMSLSRMGATI